ncbi:MAG: DUF11 domain-containing protein, partial [Chloroflexi bacterium]|nr:DUF11 domain-containing protein [Chloroflexota bacterium]
PSAALIGPSTITLAEFDSDLCGLTSLVCFGKPGVPDGSGLALDPLREVVMWRLAYRNFGGDQRIVGDFVTDVTGADDGGIRWFELQDTGGGWTLRQEGTYAGPGGAYDGVHRFMGSIAMDGDGNIALGYSVTNDVDVFPGIRYTGRLATDPPGTLPRGETVLVSATANNTSNRWGDYSAMSIDPADDCTFWYTNKYGTGQWSTQIATFAFDACLGITGNADLAISKDDGLVQVEAGSALTYTIRVTNAGPDVASGAPVVDTFPAEITSASWTCAVIAGTGACGDPGPTAGDISTTVDLAPGATAEFTVNATVDPLATPGTLISNTATVSPPPTVADPVPGNNSARDGDTLILAVPGPEPQPGPDGDSGVLIFDPGLSKVGVLQPGGLGLPGEQITWTITVIGGGAVGADDVVVVDTVPSELRIDSVSTPRGSFSFSGQTVTFTIGDISPGETLTLQIVTTVLRSPVDGTLTNVVTLSGGGQTRPASATLDLVTGLPSTGYPPPDGD